MRTSLVHVKKVGEPILDVHELGDRIFDYGRAQQWINGMLGV